MSLKNQSRIHRTGHNVGLTFADHDQQITEQVYLTPAHARALAKELVRFANACEMIGCEKSWPAVRLVVNDGLLKAKAITESSGKARVEYV